MLDLVETGVVWSPWQAAWELPAAWISTRSAGYGGIGCAENRHKRAIDRVRRTT